MSEQKPNGTTPPTPGEQKRVESSQEWSESEWFKTWLTLARKGGNHPCPSGSSEGNG
jgi:hypothetical protein